MKHFFLILLLPLSLCLHAAPRLTVFAIVDGLDPQAMVQMREYWSQGGLRTLSEEAYQTEVQFPQQVYGGDETTATLVTGQTPFFHNYTADTYFNRTDRHVHMMLEAPGVKGINTQHQFSPKDITVPTIADQFRLTKGHDAKIYAIGQRHSTTILLAGHAANACCWIENSESGWATTSFYSEGLPAAADRMNTNGRFAELAHRTWTNRLEINTYQHPTREESKSKGFSYASADYLRNTPVANTLVTELALALQHDEHLGEDPTPDLMLLQYTVVSPKATSPQITTAEQEDLYMSLNQDLGYLLEQLSRRIGKENLQLVLVGRPVMGTSAKRLTEAGLTTGLFNIDRAAALTGTYLMALYGHERWIDGGYGNSIYLNRTLIEQKKMSLPALREQVALFLQEMAGVQMAYPIDELRKTQSELQLQQLHNSLGKRSGDVIITLQYGWTLMHDERTVADHILDINPVVPLYLWYGAYHAFPNLPSPLDATAITHLID